MNGLSKIGKFLRKLRIDHVLTQADVAEMLDVSIAFYSGIETGQRPLSIKHFDILLKEIPMSEAQARELRQLAVASIKEVRIKTDNLKAKEKELVVEFSRSFQQVSSSDQAQILELLRKGRTD